MLKAAAWGLNSNCHGGGGGGGGCLVLFALKNGPNMVLI